MVQRKVQLETFQLVNEDRVISPILTTTRKYGDWFEGTFDEYTAQTELYLKSKKKTGESLLERHPGTRIGAWFDSVTLGEDFQSYFIMQDSPMFDRLVKLHLAEPQDAVPISVNDVEHRKMIRVYTTKQIELYIRSVLLYRSFNISSYLGTPKQIKVRNVDLDKVIMPKVQHRKRLF